MDDICTDLAAEHAVLDSRVADRGDGAAELGWDTATAAPGWTVRDQISHLWFFDQRALLALRDPVEFVADAARLMAAGGTHTSVLPGRAMSGEAMLAEWRRDRQELLDHARTIDPAARVPWYGPAMAARSFITARLMETWAHGYDVADALGVTPEATDRLRHVAHIGVRSRPFSYAIHGRTMPDVDVHVALTAPSGTTSAWGSPDALDTVHGPMLDFCLAVTQRRHRADTALEIHGDAATEWMSIAQAFAGAPGEGRAIGQFNAAS